MIRFSTTGLKAVSALALAAAVMISAPASEAFAASAKAAEKKAADWWYSDSDGYVAIRKIKYKGTACWCAHLKFKKYSRLRMIWSKGSRGKKETTYAAAKRTKAVFAVNGDYCAPSICRTALRGGKVYGGKGRLYASAVYSRWDGILGSPQSKGAYGMDLNTVVEKRLASDTFQFAPAFDLKHPPKKGGSRAQRTFIGTNGKPGDVWVFVTNGRKNDGKSKGLTARECVELLIKHGCTFGVALDGGGSSSMVFKGRILNHAGNRGEGKRGRAVVDHLIYK